MRALILVAGAALALSACSSSDSANNTMIVEDNLATDTTDMNAMDMNAVDANMTMNADVNADANAVDATATNNAM